MLVRTDWTLREKVLGIALGVAVIILVISFLTQQDSPEPLSVPLEPYQQMGKEKKQSGGDSARSSKAVKIIIDVKGAVNHPGIYQLDANSRVYAAVEKAGGAKRTADLNRVNLAQPLSDGMVVYIPHKGETIPLLFEGNNGMQSAGQNVNSYREDKINVNTATVQELEKLEGIGTAKAQAIIRYREEHGNFRSVEDLKNVPGIGDKTLAKFQDKITVQ